MNGIIELNIQHHGIDYFYSPSLVYFQDLFLKFINSKLRELTVNEKEIYHNLMNFFYDIYNKDLSIRYDNGFFMGGKVVNFRDEMNKIDRNFIYKGLFEFTLYGSLNEKVNLYGYVIEFIIDKFIQKVEPEGFSDSMIKEYQEKHNLFWVFVFNPYIKPMIYNIISLNILLINSLKEDYDKFMGYILYDD